MFTCFKVNFEVHSKGDSFLMQIAHTEMPREEIVNNIIDAASNLDKHFPGGWDNVRALYIRTRTSMSLPVYCTLSMLQFFFNFKIISSFSLLRKQIRS